MFDFRAVTIISGGQTGADRAALDFALQQGISYGGWCPRGRLSEDGPIPPQYDLQETPSARYSQRTWRNVRDSDATVAFTIGSKLVGGTRLTAELAAEAGRPLLHLMRDSESPESTGSDRYDSAVAWAAAMLRAFLQEHQVRRLNVAGPRESQEPEIAAFVMGVLQAALID